MKLIFWILFLLSVAYASNQNLSVAVFNYVGISNTNIVVQTSESSDINVEIILNTQNQLNVSGCLTNVSIPTNGSSSSSSSTGIMSSSIVQSSSLLPLSSSSIDSSSLSSSMLSSSVFSSSSSLPSSSLISSSLVSSSISSSKSISSSSSSNSNGRPVAGYNLCGSYNISTISPFTTLNAPVYYTNVTINVDSVSGNDQGWPLKTITAAQLMVQSLLLANNHQTITVVLNGTFYQTQPITMGLLDSPNLSSNNFVIYTSANPNTPAVISGGVRLPSNWTLMTGSSSIYTLYVGNNYMLSRGLYVNNVRMTKARTGFISPSAVNLGNFPIITNIDCSACGLPSISPFSLVDVEMVMLANWQMWRCQGNLSSTNRLLVSVPCANFVDSQVSNPILAYVENAIPFLTVPGTWVSNINGGGYIYAIPPTGVMDLNIATVVISKLETILNVTNSNNIIFENLEFAHGDYPDISTNVGFSIWQADILFTQNFYNYFGVDLPYVLNDLAQHGQQIFVPTAVYCVKCQNVGFFGNTFTHLSASGLRIGDSSYNTLIWNNTFQDISGSGIQIGNGFLSGNTVLNTYVQGNTFYQVAIELYSSVGINQLYATGTSITYNMFDTLGYTAISTGLSQSMIVIPNNDHNSFIGNRMQNILLYTQDGAGLYWNGYNNNTYVDGNYCFNISSGYYHLGYDYYLGSNCLYLDYGTYQANITQNNVADNILNFLQDNSAVYTNSYPLPSEPNGFIETSILNTTITRMYSGPVGLTTCTYNSPYLPSNPPLLAFGGLYGLYNTGQYYVNSLTGSANCPTGYLSVDVYGIVSHSWSITMCYHIFNNYNNSIGVTNGFYFTHNGSINSTIQTFTFAGIYGAGVNNPFTNAQTCPSGYTSQQFSGSAGLNYNMYVCTRAYQTSDSLWTFGGTYSNLYPNILSFTQACSSGFSSYPAFLNTFSGTLQANLSFCALVTTSTSSSSSSTAGSISSSIVVSSSSSSPILSSSTSSSSIATILVYGGMYGQGDGIDYPNILTGTLSCPNGYSNVLFSGQTNDNYNAYVCVQSIPASQPPTYIFGGMYSSNYSNPYTSINACPLGFNASLILGSITYDPYIYTCVKNYVASIDNGTLFGGIYSIGSVTSYTNSFTGDYTCPPNFRQFQTAGNLSDYGFTMGQRYGPYPSIYYCVNSITISIYTSSVSLVYGGMYGYAFQTTYVNNFTGSDTCPVGYTAQHIFGVVSVAYDMYVCNAFIPSSNLPSYSFTGLSGTVNGCPAGYQTNQVYGNPALYACQKPYQLADGPSTYNGFYSSYLDGGIFDAPVFVDILTLNLLCPNRTQPILITTYPLLYCYS